MMIPNSRAYVCMDPAPILSFRDVMTCEIFLGPCWVSCCRTTQVDLNKLDPMETVAQLHLLTDVVNRV